jgi:MoaA/NifB/PqqE/SkfB family radical SAM enzyme
MREVRSCVSRNTPLFVGIPTVVHVWRKGACNSRCLFCAHDFLPPERKQEFLHSPLTEEMVPALIDSIAELGGRGTIVSYVGTGEPMLTAGLMQWAHQVRRHQMKFRFTTNGLLLDDRRVAAIREAGVFNVGVSIEALDPLVHETLRKVPGGAAKTLAGIERLIAARQEDASAPSVNVKVVVTALNLGSLEEFLLRWGRLQGVVVTPTAFNTRPEMPAETIARLQVNDRQKLVPLVARWKELRSQGYALNASDEALDEIATALCPDDPAIAAEPAAPVRRHRCDAGLFNLYVVDGSIRLCPRMPEIGNFVDGDRSLVRVWYGERAREVRRMIDDCSMVCLAACTRPMPLSQKIRAYLKQAA